MSDAKRNIDKGLSADANGLVDENLTVLGDLEPEESAEDEIEEVDTDIIADGDDFVDGGLEEGDSGTVSVDGTGIEPELIPIQKMPLADIVPYANNPRKNTKGISFVEESIKAFGFRNPVLVDSENVIICGHTRYEAAKKLQLKEIPVRVCSDLTPEQVRAFRLADNKVSECSKWNTDLLEIELAQISIDGVFDMSVFNFTDLDANPGSNIDEAEVFQVVVDCTGESDQRDLYDRMRKEGRKCKVLTM